MTQKKKSSGFGKDLTKRQGRIVTFLFYAGIVLNITGLLVLLLFNQIAKTMSDYTYQVTTKGVDWLVEADRDAYQSRLAAAELIYHDNLGSSETEQLISDVTVNYQQSKERFEKFEKAVSRNKTAFLKDIGDFHSFYSKWETASIAIITAMKENRRTDAERMYNGEYDEVFEPMRNAMNNLTDKLLDTSEKHNQDSISNWSKVSLISYMLIVYTILLAGIGYLLVTAMNRSRMRKVYYEAILDAVPMPINVTDLDMKWTFVNKAQEQSLKKKREEVVGHHCSEWGAEICDTERCGITCMKNGQDHSDFINPDNQHYNRASVTYIKDTDQQIIGHVEIISDIDAEKKVLMLAAQVRESVRQMESGIRQLAASGQVLSRGASEQASSLEEITSSVTELSGRNRENLELTVKADNSAKDSARLSEQGSVEIQKLVKTTEDISSSSSEVKRIVKVIDEIAFQINLLALNANVEAARAGKYGKGFAVVAEEVRNLAVRSGKAVQETTAKIEQSLALTEEISKLVTTAAGYFAKLKDGSETASQNLSQISTAARETTSGLEQIKSAINQIENVTQSNAASAEETASASEELSGQAGILNEMVKQFDQDQSKGQIAWVEPPAPKKLPVMNDQTSQNFGKF